LQCMTSGKKLSIGITINLGNYENLRLQVDGEVTETQDADELITYLDAVLSRIGRGDTATAERIDSYRHRVLIQPEKPSSLSIEPAVAAVEDVEKEGVEGTPEREKALEEIPDGDLPELLYHKAADAVCVEQATTGVCENEVCELAATVPTEEISEKEAKKPKEGKFFCSECGVEITRAQEQLSQLFMGKSVCRKCMELQK
jgi:hypothetical protein